MDKWKIMAGFQKECPCVLFSLLLLNHFSNLMSYFYYFIKYKRI